MRRARGVLAALLCLTLVPGLAATARPTHAATGIGTAQTDFTKVTPGNAVLFAALQPTAADQQANLKALEDAIMSQPGLPVRTGAGHGTGNPMAGAMIKQVLSSLNTLFNGELGLAMLPPTTVTAANGKVLPRLHLLVDAGLQTGVTAGQLSGAMLVLGLPTTPSSTYHNVPIITIDLQALKANFAPGRKATTTARENGPISSTLYSAVIGNDLVLATDLPTLQAAIDVSSGAQPSIAANPDYQAAFSALPDGRLGMLYVHFDLAAAASLARALHNGLQMPRLAGKTGTYSQAFAVSAKPDGILLTASTSTRTGDLATSVSLSPLQNGTAATLPDNTLFYASLGDPGALFHALIQQGLSLAQQSNFPIKPLDPIKVLNRTLGLDVDHDLLSWMHGEAGLALLPVGSDALAGFDPAAKNLSLVATLQVSDQATVDAALQKLDASLQDLSTDPTGLQLVTTPGTNPPQRILAATPNGIGYTFNNGYLVSASALPADLAALQAVTPTSNLGTNPLYKAALSYAGSGPFGAVVFANLSGLRQAYEAIAQDNGMDLTYYNQAIRPYLTAFNSLALVANPGANGGGILFIGIGR